MEAFNTIRKHARESETARSLRFIRARLGRVQRNSSRRSRRRDYFRAGPNSREIGVFSGVEVVGIVDGGAAAVVVCGLLGAEMTAPVPCPATGFNTACTFQFAAGEAMIARGSLDGSSKAC